MCSSLGKVRAKAISSNILHLVFIWHGWDRDVSILSEELLVEKEKICEAPSHGKVVFREGFEIRLFGD